MAAVSMGVGAEGAKLRLVRRALLTAMGSARFFGMRGYRLGSSGGGQSFHWGHGH